MAGAGELHAGDLMVHASAKVNKHQNAKATDWRMWLERSLLIECMSAYLWVGVYGSLIYKTGVYASFSLYLIRLRHCSTTNVYGELQLGLKAFLTR